MSDYKIFYTIIILFTTLIISCVSDSPVDPKDEKISHGSGVIANEKMGMLLRQAHSLVIFKDKIWMFGGLQHRFGMKDVWYSEDGINWKLATEEADFPARVQHAAFAYDDKMWIIGGEIVGGFFQDIWYTEDGSHWVEAAADTPLGRRNGHSSVVFDNKMWVIGGTEISDDFNETYVRNDDWYSSDVVNWQKKDLFFGRSGHANAVLKIKYWVLVETVAPLQTIMIPGI